MVIYRHSQFWMILTGMTGLISQVFFLPWLQVDRRVSKCDAAAKESSGHFRYHDFQWNKNLRLGFQVIRESSFWRAQFHDFFEMPEILFIQKKLKSLGINKILFCIQYNFTSFPPMGIYIHVTGVSNVIN